MGAGWSDMGTTVRTVPAAVRRLSDIAASGRAGPGRDEAPAEGTDTRSASTGAQPLGCPGRWVDRGRSRVPRASRPSVLDAVGGPARYVDTGVGGGQRGGERSIEAGPRCICRPPFGVWCSPPTSRRAVQSVNPRDSPRLDRHGVLASAGSRRAAGCSWRSPSRWWRSVRSRPAWRSGAATATGTGWPPGRPPRRPAPRPRARPPAPPPRRRSTRRPRPPPPDPAPPRPPPGSRRREPTDPPPADHTADVPAGHHVQQPARAGYAGQLAGHVRGRSRPAKASRHDSGRAGSTRSPSGWATSWHGAQPEHGRWIDTNNAHPSEVESWRHAACARVRRERPRNTAGASAMWTNWIDSDFHRKTSATPRPVSTASPWSQGQQDGIYYGVQDFGRYP